jgi:hypothetical protein
VLVESGMPDLGSCATPVVPGLGGKGMRKTPSLRPSKAPTRSTHTLVRDNSRSSHRRAPPSIGFPLSSGHGGENHSHNWSPSIAPPIASAMSRSVVTCLRHRLILTKPHVPSPCGLRWNGRCAFAITLAHRIRHSHRWCVPTRGEIGWESQIGAPTSKVPYTDILTKSLRK